MLVLFNLLALMTCLLSSCSTSQSYDLSDSLSKGEVKTYTLNNVDYEVTFTSCDKEAHFTVNDELIDLLLFFRKKY